MRYGTSALVLVLAACYMLPASAEPLFQSGLLVIEKSTDDLRAICKTGWVPDCVEAANKAFALLVAAPKPELEKLKRESCTSDAWQVGDQLLTRATKLASVLRENMEEEIRYAPGYPTPAKLKIHGNVLDFSAELLLKVGNMAVSRGCPDEAEKQFKNVLATFSGTRFVSFRERAMVGIADVRERRDSWSCKILGRC